MKSEYFIRDVFYHTLQHFNIVQNIIYAKETAIIYEEKKKPEVQEPGLKDDNDSATERLEFAHQILFTTGKTLLCD